MNKNYEFEAHRDQFTEDMLVMKTRLEYQVNVLERQSKLVPLEEFFRPNFLDILSKTADPKDFARILHSVGTLSAVPHLTIGEEKDYLEKIYNNFVFKKGHCWQLILAWSLSQNNHLLKELQKWLNKAEQTQRTDLVDYNLN